MDNISAHYKSTIFASEIEYLFNSSNPYFLKGSGKLIKNGASSLIAFFHPEHDYCNDKFVNFGYWNCSIESEQAALFSDLKKWAKEMGVKQILGPMNFSTLHSYRLPLNDYKDFFWGEPVGSLKEFNTLIKQGFNLAEKYSTHYISNPEKIYKWGMQRSKRVEKQNENLHVLSFKDIIKKNRKNDLYDLIELTFKQNVGYLKSSKYELDYLFNESVLEAIIQSPSFVVENLETKSLCGIFVSYAGENIFDKSCDKVLFYKTIGAHSVDNKKQSQIFFYLIHQIFKHYKDLGVDWPISFALMREGNVAEKVAKKFSDKQRDYGLFLLKI